jgi:hypothetical protein
LDNCGHLPEQGPGTTEVADATLSSIVDVLDQ